MPDVLAVMAQMPPVATVEPVPVPAAVEEILYIWLPVTVEAPPAEPTFNPIPKVWPEVFVEA